MQNGSAAPTGQPTDLDKRIADFIDDIDKDVEDDFTEADENDPALLAELAKITGGGGKVSGSHENESERDTRSPVVVLPTDLLGKIQTLKSRLEMYELAEKAANEADESTRARRFNRGIQTINDLLKQALGGDDISAAEIPPEVSMKNVPVEGAEQGEEAKEKK